MNQIAKQLGTAYRTAFKATMTLRMAIAAASQNDDALTPEKPRSNVSKKPGKHKSGVLDSIPIFGVQYYEERVSVRHVPELSAQSLIDLGLEMTRFGNIVYTGRYESYDALAFCDYGRVRVERKLRPIQWSHTKDPLEEFWMFLNDGMKKYRGVSLRYMALYFKELAFRFNHRRQDLFPIMVTLLCHFKPRQND